MTLRMISKFRPVRDADRAVVGDSLDTAFRVAPSDLDVLLHMNNGRYLSILDAARVSYQVRTGLWRQLRSRKWHPVVAAQTISYRRSLTLGTKFVVRTRFLGFDAKNAVFEQTFVVGEHVYATAVAACRYLDSDGKSLSPNDIRGLDVTWGVPDAIPRWVADWSESLRAHASEATRAATE